MVRWRSTHAAHGMKIQSSRAEVPSIVTLAGGGPVNAAAYIAGETIEVNGGQLML